MKINFKKLIICILITFFVGNLFVLFISSNNTYDSLNKLVEVPGVIFPIVWSILFLFMAISWYIILESEDRLKPIANKIYWVQLFVNSLWTLWFFGLKLYYFSFFWIILLIVLVILMIKYFYQINKFSGYINIPYLLWLLFAAFLNISIAVLN